MQGILIAIKSIHLYRQQNIIDVILYICYVNIALFINLYLYINK